MSARIDIPKDKIEEFCRHNRIHRLALFGSVLRDDFTSESDTPRLKGLIGIENYYNFWFYWNILGTPKTLTGSWSGFRFINFIKAGLISSHFSRAISRQSNLFKPFPINHPLPGSFRPGRR